MSQYDLYTSRTLTPAYGRDYKSAAAVKKDFEANKDFVCHQEGQYINRKQIAPGVEIGLRYAKQTRITYIIVK